MKKIRIGNDIKLRVKLLGVNVVDPININSIKAYIINTTVQQQQIQDLKNKTKFMSRFPIEPMIDAYTSSSYNINSCGYPTYHAFPQNHVIGSYAGFGPEPSWKDIYRPMPQHNLTEFLAPVRADKARNAINLFFPAEAQLFTGTYKIVIVAKIYEPGFAPNDLRTVTMDYENIFTLVNTSEDGVDSAVTLEVNSPGEHVPDNFAIGGSLTGDKKKIKIDMNDDSTNFNIDISEETAWYNGDPEDQNDSDDPAQAPAQDTPSDTQSPSDTDPQTEQDAPSTDNNETEPQQPVE